MNELKTYRINIDGPGTFEYEYLGPAPSAINAPDLNSFAVTNRGVKDFALKATADYNYNITEYTYYPANASETFIVVDYYCPEGDVKQFDALTDEINNKYSLKMDQVKYSSTDVVYGSRTYAKLLDFFFADTYDPSQPYDYYTVRASVPK